MKDYSTTPPQERPNIERNQKLIRMYGNGERYSYNSLARMFKISPQRVRQIILKYREELA